MLAGAAFAEPTSIDDKAVAQAAVFKEHLQLTADQETSVVDALKEKLEVGKKAHQLKKGGDEEGAKALNKEAGKKFQETLNGILTKEQRATWKAGKEAIMEKVREIK